MKNKSNILLVIGILVLMFTIGGITYAFFNYVRTGSVNTIKVGTINFTFQDGNTINLENMFPITRQVAQNDNSENSTCEIIIRGNNTYADGVEYKVSTADTHLSITRDNKPMEVPIGVIVNVESNGEGLNDNLGVEDNDYFTNRENYTTSHYKKLAKSSITDDQMLLVGFIAKDENNTDNSINGKITIKAYFDDDNIIITDTPDEVDTGDKVIFTTTEWNGMSENGLSFKIKVEANEGIWIDMPLYELMQKDAVLDNIQSNFVDSVSGIDFSHPATYTDNETVINNGKGLYKMASTANDDYPIVYYRGDIDNNNVVFANKCWKMVRTTDTGGVKLLYNGEYSEKFNTTPLPNESDYTIATNSGNTFTWNDTTKTFDVSIQNRTATELSFTVSEGDDYILEVTGITGASGNGTLELYNGNDLVKSYDGGYGGLMNLSSELGSLTTSDTIKVTYTAKTASAANYTNLSVKMTTKGESLGINCDNSVADAQINVGTQTGFAFVIDDAESNSPAYNGYMYGTIYEVVSEAPVSNAIFGSGFVYENGVYKLTGTDVGVATTRHYTCNSTDANATCQSIRYYNFVLSPYYYYYLELSNGKSIEDALSEMQVNETSSNAKNVIDSWYATNIATSNANTNKIEDTIWCNDRSVSSLGGFNPNGGSVNGNLFYSGYQRIYTDNTPSLACVNQNDAFTVNSAKGNRNLTYPVALLTADELVLAGAKCGTASNFYANSRTFAWTLSPSRFAVGSAIEFTLHGSSELGNLLVSSVRGLRPSLSLKNGVGFSSGNGTAADPYIVS